jgi:glycosyltransferase involved in cell wall biosynthesis
VNPRRHCSSGKTYPHSLLVFSDDWGRHPSSCQHLVRELLESHQVLWVNTIGTRRPSFDLATLQRGLEKIRHWTRGGPGSAALPRNLRVLTPKMWPWFRTSLDRKLNRELLLRQLAPTVRALRPPVAALTTLPIVADLIGLLPVARWVYYCVDDFGEWPGLDRAAMQAMDEALIHGADQLIAVSETLQQKMARMRREAVLLTHGVDLGFWKASNNIDSAPEFEGLQRPLVVFWGVVDKRMDVPFVRRLAADMTEGTIVLIGPEADPEPGLMSAGRVRRLLPVPYARLPQLAQAASVLIMPYADLPVTRAMQPLKLKEYLATGKPAVVRDLPATRSWSDAADLASNAEAFSRLVRLRIETGLPESQEQSRTRLRRESWQEKARTLERWISDREFPFHATTCA